LNFKQYENTTYFNLCQPFANRFLILLNFS
jgi:hypothetical protein